MSKEETTLKDFFSFKSGEISQKKMSSMEILRKVSAVKDVITKEAEEIRWPVAFDEIMRKTGDLLDVSLGDIMARAWNKYRVLAKYLDREKYSPSETFLVPLAEHTIKSDHKPHVDILLGEQLLGTIDFEIKVSLTLKGFIVRVQDGKIMEIKTGTCKAKGSITCEDLLIFEKETDSVTLPGTIGLGDGVPISLRG